MPKKKGKISKIKKFLKKTGIIKFLKRNGLILLLVFIAFSMILTIFISDKFKNNKLENNKLEKNIIVKNNYTEILKKTEKLKINNKKENIFSCNDLYKLGERKSGMYEINIRGEEQKGKMKIYCDMETSGGGWTLLLTSVSAGWNVENVISRNSKNPSIIDNYSILGKADKIKSMIGEKFQYRIDANKFGENGGIWEANEDYSFLSKSNLNTNIKLIEKYGIWEYSTFGIEERMPYLCNTEFGILSTSVNCSSKWYGTILAKDDSFVPAPWIHSIMKNPGVIWYWVK